VRTLVFWGDAPLAEAKARAARGDRVLLFGRPDAAKAPDLPTVDFGSPARERIEQAVLGWTEALAERPMLRDGRFAELFAWQEEPLWPLAREFFLSEESAGGRCVRLVESFSVVFEAELPDEVEAVGLREDEGALLARACTARGVLFQGESRRRPARQEEKATEPGLGDRLRHYWEGFSGKRPEMKTGALILVRPPVRAPRASARGVTARGETARGALSSAFERLLIVARDEMSLPVAVLGGEDDIDPATLLDPVARRAVEEAETGFARAFQELKDAPSTAAAFFHEGVSFGDLCAFADLENLLKHALPRAVRRAEGVRTALRASRASALCATAEDALALRAARVEGTPTVPFGAAADGPRVLLALEAAARGAGMVG
jgi:hypothetical protein